ncbi:hypothetical protein Leryth_023500, partial [Lithospermum erythrorhizon]
RKVWSLSLSLVQRLKFDGQYRFILLAVGGEVAMVIILIVGFACLSAHNVLVLHLFRGLINYHLGQY